MSDYRRPLPQPDRDTSFYWEAARAGRLSILRCTSCHQYRHYPQATCLACGGTQLTPTVMSGRGTIHSFTITHYPSTPGFDDATPFVVVLVALEEAPTVRIIANLRGCAASDVRIGMPVAAVFEPVTDDITLPQFRLRPEQLRGE